MKQAIAHTKNLTHLMETAEALSRRGKDLPGIGMIWGPSGAGKTTGAVWLRDRSDAICVRAMRLWRPAAMLAAICKELDVLPSPRCAPMLDQVIERLRQSQRPVIIDEADYLIQSPALLDTLRDIHDVSSAPIIVIGMGTFRQRVQGKEQFSGRIAQIVEFRPADLDDVRATAEACCEVALDDALLERITRETQGSMRRVKTALSVVEQWADRRGETLVTAAAWGTQPLDGTVGAGRRLPPGGAR